MTPENILNAVRGVLKQRGRCIGGFKSENGRVDQLGALAIAGGHDADMWRFWRDLDFEELDADTLVLVEAARLLAEAQAPLQPVRSLPLHRLVMLLGDSNDLATDAQILGWVEQAASLAAQRGVAA